MHAAGSTGAGPRGRAPYRGRRFDTESLEPRMLLTTLIGGETFEYVDSSLLGSVQLARVRLQGNIRVELVGAAVTSQNQAEIANLAGRIIEPDGSIREVFGGLGGPGGIDIIGPVVSSTAQPDINAIAADEAGNMYALQIVQIPLPPEAGLER